MHTINKIFIFTAHKYHSRQEFLADVERILQNCVTYNGKDSTFTEKAEALYKAAQETLDEVSLIRIEYECLNPLILQVISAICLSH